MSQKKAKLQPLTLAKDDRSEDPGPDTCPKCFGTGMAYLEDGSVGRCACRRQNAHASLLASAMIPRRYDSCHFNTFKPSTPSQERAFKFASRLAMDYPAVDQGLLLSGTVGVGKTHLAVSIIKGLAERGFLCRFCEFGALLKEIQNSYNPISKTSELAVLAPVFNAEVLVLDEIGASKPTDWVRDTMALIINTRYNDRKLTIFTTNYLDSVSDPREETLEDRIGIRLRSRLFEMSKTVVISGEDYRKTFDRPAAKRA